MRVVVILILKFCCTCCTVAWLACVAYATYENVACAMQHMHHVAYVASVQHATLFCMLQTHAIKLYTQPYMPINLGYAFRLWNI